MYVDRSPSLCVNNLRIVGTGPAYLYRFNSVPDDVESLASEIVKANALLTNLNTSFVFSVATMKSLLSVF